MQDVFVIIGMRNSRHERLRGIFLCHLFGEPTHIGHAHADEPLPRDIRDESALKIRVSGILQGVKLFQDAHIR